VRSKTQHQSNKQNKNIEKRETVTPNTTVGREEKFVKKTNILRLRLNKMRQI